MTFSFYSSENVFSWKQICLMSGMLQKSSEFNPNLEGDEKEQDKRR